jgi:hypothetical protein
MLVCTPGAEPGEQITRGVSSLVLTPPSPSALIVPYPTISPNTDMFSLNLVYNFSDNFNHVLCNQLLLLRYHDKFLNEHLERFVLFFLLQNTVYCLPNI